ncbi:condensin complex subunit 2 [Aphidius gifuensis]|uniref:condensin complex subunit 2 n=1 Tax=Aphidius gifuensis TaxID=684658 RepID=UPI001CDD72BD|nr:condensin complex subunit 2 [Aphidius gifuensis]
MENRRKSLGHALLMENATLLESSPLRRRSVIAQRSTPAPIDDVVNDDKTERSGSRRSLGLSGITRMTVPQIRDGIAECIKLNTQNKINIKNAFSLSMIDFMEYMVKNRDEGLSNLQIASTTLDVSAKIYGLRVDSLHQDTMKMVGHLDKQSQDDHNNNDGNRDSGAGDDNNPNDNHENNQNINSQSDRIKKKRKSSQKILVTIESLQTKPDKVSLEPPMFGDADCQTTDMLYQVMLPKHCNKNLNLHPYKDVYFDEEIPLDKDHNNDDEDDDDDDELLNVPWPVIKPNGSQNMMSMFENFSFLNWDPNDNESVTSSQEILDNLNESLPFNLNASLPAGGSENGTGGNGPNSNNDVYSNTNYFDINDDYDDDEVHVNAQFQQVDRLSEKIVDIEKVLTVVGKKTSEQLEYSYIRDTVNIFQAGPSTWTVKNKNRQSRLFGRCRQDGPKKKKEFTIEYSQLTADNVDKNFTTLTRVNANNKNKYPVGWKKEKFLFESCDFYDTEKTIKYNTRDERYLRVQKALTFGGVDGATDGDNNNDPNNFNVSYETPEFNNDDDDHNDDGQYDDINNNDNDMIIDDNNDNQQMNQDLTQNNNNENEDNVGFSQGAFVGDNLVEAPKLTEKIYIPFSQRAKKLDMRNLKKTIWKSLDTKDDGEKENCQIGDADDSDTTTNDQHIVKDIKQFSDVFVQLPNKLNKNDASELTFPLAFVSLLHLANEKNLRIISNNENSDLSIFQDIH